MGRKDGKFAQVKDERLDSVNAMYRSGAIDVQVATKQVDLIVLDYRVKERPDKIVYTQSNLDIFEKYFREEYENRDILSESLKAAKASFRRALALLGTLEISSASPKEVQKKIFSLPHKKRQHVVLAMNALFKFAKREVRFEIGNKRTEVERVRYLSLEEFLLILPHISNPLVRTMAAVGFATGCRVGEIFPLSMYNELNRVVTILSQIDRKMRERATKTYQQRTAVVVKQLEPYLKEWLLIPVDIRLSIRNVRLGQCVRNACQIALPERKDKHCHFYDLRHSYAIHFLGMGVAIDLIASALGNSPEVCRRHYTGHVLSDGGTTLMNLIQERV